MAGRGGRRPGSGRKKGGTNLVSKAAREAMAATGMLPHEILCRLGRGEKVAGFKKNMTEERRIDCLKASAQFYAPKMLGALVKTAQPGDANPWAQLMSMVQGKSRGLPAKSA